MNWRRGFKRLGYVVSAVYWLAATVVAIASLSILFDQAHYTLTTKVALVCAAFVAMSIGYWSVYYLIRLCIWIGRGFAERPADASTKDEGGVVAP